MIEFPREWHYQGFDKESFEFSALKDHIKDLLADCPDNISIRYTRAEPLIGIERERNKYIKIDPDGYYDYVARDPIGIDVERYFYTGYPEAWDQTIKNNTILLIKNENVDCLGIMWVSENIYRANDVFFCGLDQLDIYILKWILS